MSNIAKVFIVVNFVLSAVYLAFSATLLSQKWDYRQMYLESLYKNAKQMEELKNEKDDANSKIETISEHLALTKKTAKEYQEKFKLKQEEVSRLKRKNESFDIKLSKITADIKEINSRLEKKETRISELETARDRQKEIAEEAIKAKEEAQDSEQRMEIKLSNLQGEIAEKEKLLQRSEKELWEAKQIIRAVRAAGVNIPSLFTKAKPMDAKIVAVSKDVPLVMLSIGSDDGVKKGYQFTIYRESRYIGRVVIEEVYKDMAAARILKKMTIRAIKKGDNATTRIGGGGNF